jgi:hypothetical protein
LRALRMRRRRSLRPDGSVTLLSGARGTTRASLARAGSRAQPLAITGASPVDYVGTPQLAAKLCKPAPATPRGGTTTPTPRRTRACNLRARACQSASENEPPSPAMGQAAVERSETLVKDNRQPQVPTPEADALSWDSEPASSKPEGTTRRCTRK